MIISRLIPRKIAAIIKSKDQIREYKNKLQYIRQNPNKYVYLIGTPNHSNLGDHLIALAEISFLTNNTHMDVMDIPTEMFQIYKRTLRDIIPRSSLVFITGGGWMGDVWPIEERTLESIMMTFYQNNTLIFPQTVYYQRPEIEERISRRARISFMKCRNVVLCVRDMGSYNYCITHYNNNVILCPDIALYYKKELKQNRKKKKIGICFRDDREKNKHLSAYDIMQKCMFEDIEFVRLSTISESNISCSERKSKVNELIDIFHDCSLVITDRLHGMIYSFLAETPCIAFDNKTCKVSGVYELWLKSSPSIVLLNPDSTAEVVYDTGNKLLNEEFCAPDNNFSFKSIEEVIDRWKK